MQVGPFLKLSGSLGYDATCKKNWFFGKLPEEWTIVVITLEELYPIVAAFHVWGCFANQSITIHTDNKALVSTLNSKTSKDIKIMVLVRTLVVKSMIGNFQIKAAHIPGVENVLADKLSRLQVESFKKLAPWAEKQPITLPPEMLPENWFRGC